MKFNKKLQTVFLDPHSSEFKVTGKVNVVLSPAFYWVKKLTLPIKSVGAVKKLLPSLFEDSLPEGRYSYYAYKKEDTFIAFAYEDKVILDTLSQKGLKPANVANIYFAQSELEGIETDFKIDKTQNIALKDDIVILLPTILFEKSQYVDLTDITLSKHKITLTQFGHIVDSKSIYKITAIVLAFIFLVAIELFITTQKTDKIVTLQEELFTKYKLQATMFQNKSMLKKYNKIHTKQMKLREYTSAILSFRLKGDAKLTQLILKDKRLVAYFSDINQRNKSYIQKVLTGKKIPFKSSFKKKIFHLEMAL